MCNLKSMLWIYTLSLFTASIVFLTLEILVTIRKYMTSTIYDDWKIHLSETADSNDCKQFENNHFIKDWPIYMYY